MVRPFAALGLDFGLYGGYNSIDVFVGRITRPLEGLEAITPNMEVFRGDDAVAIFVEKSKAEEVRDLLTRQGFNPLEPPAQRGDPKEHLEKLGEDKAKWAERLAEINRRLEVLREKYASFIVGAEDYFSVQIEKAEAPLRFATSRHSFVVDGWVPTAKVAPMKEGVEALGAIHVEAYPETDGHSEPPVLLDNPRPVKPFEMLLSLFSTPSYRELDPTVVLALIFPIFFGFMIGDAGYGAVWLALGVFALTKLEKGSDFWNLMFAITLGGFFSLIFGLFVFGDMFGIPFHDLEKHPPIYGHVVHHGEGKALSWESLVGLHFPTDRPIFAKLFSITDLIVLSLVAAFIHLLIGFSMGVVNELRHNKKHAVAKAAWLLVLFGLFTLIMVRAWDPYPDPGEHKLANDILSIPPLSYFPGAEGLPMESLGFGPEKPIPFATLGLLISGTGILAFTESPLAVVEVVGLLANMISYARLAGIAVAKAAMAEAFNVGIFENMVLAGDPIWLGLGIFFLFLAHTMIFFLGSISAGIQSIRLHYVELFLKFFKGGGTPFQPFGVRTRGTEA
jgi:V/A-type H+-transporting ATPase subunit I